MQLTGARHMKAWAVALCAGALALSAASSAKADLTITTGSESGTYFRFGNEIAEVAAGVGVRVKVVPSAGSIHNLERLLGYEGPKEGEFYQLAIVQADVLSELRRHAKGQPVLERIVDNVKTVMPLYYEEVHLFTHSNAGIRSVSDLKGRVVAVGEPSSGTYMTAGLIFRLAGLEWDPSLHDPSTGEQALQQLKSGFIEAFFQVAGAPTKLGARDISQEDKLTFAAVDGDGILGAGGDVFRRAQLTRDQYSWLRQPVDTIAVASLLVAFNYKGENCDQIRKVAGAILDNLKTLQREDGRAHPKWRQVEPRAALNRSDVYECVRTTLQ